MKGKALKRLVALAVAVCMTVGLLPTNAFAATDTAGHWAKSYLEKLVAQGVMSAYEDGYMKPDAAITKAELITMINKVFGFVEEEKINPSVVKWYTPEFQKAVKAGYISANDANTMQEAPVNRQQAALYMYKAFGLPAGQAKLLTFKDSDQIDAGYKVAVASMVENKLMSGNDDGTFRPKDSLTRAQAAVSISIFAGDVYSKAGEYNKNGSKQTAKGNVVINKADVELANMNIKGNLYIAPGVGDGDVTLSNVSVTGNTYVMGGGANSIKIKDSTLGNVIVDKKDNKPVRLELSGKSEIKDAGIKSFAILSTDNLSKDAAGFKNIYVPKDANKKTELKLSGNFKQIEIIGNAIVDLLKGKIEDLNVRSNVVVVVKTTTGAVIVKLRTESAVEVNGKKVASGSEAKVSASGTVSSGTVAAAPTPVPTAVPTAPPSSSNNGSTGESTTTTPSLTPNYIGVMDSTHITFTLPQGQTGSVTVAVTGNGYDGDVQYSGLMDTYIISLSKPLTLDLAYTLLISKAGYNSYVGSVVWKGSSTLPFISVTNVKVLSPTQFTFTVPGNLVEGMYIYVRDAKGNHIPAEHISGSNGVMTVTLSKPLEDGVVYTLALNKNGYNPFRGNFGWSSIPQLQGTVSISGTPMCGEILTADARITSSEPGELKYQWKRDGADINGANAMTYKTVEADVDTAITVEVSAKNYSGSIISASVTISKAYTASDADTLLGKNWTVVSGGSVTLAKAPQSEEIAYLAPANTALENLKSNGKTITELSGDGNKTSIQVPSNEDTYYLYIVYNGKLVSTSKNYTVTVFTLSKASDLLLYDVGVAISGASVQLVSGPSVIVSGAGVQVTLDAAPKQGETVYLALEGMSEGTSESTLIAAGVDGSTITKLEGNGNVRLIELPETPNKYILYAVYDKVITTKSKTAVTVINATK